MSNRELNLFLETQSEQRFVVKIRFGRSIDTFAELERLSAALQTIDALTRTDFSDELRIRKGTLKLRARIINFYVGSPPEITALTILPWLAFFVATMSLLVTTLANYDKLKKNIPDIANDIADVLSKVRGLTDEQMRRLEHAVRLIIDSILQLPEERFRRIADRIARVRRELLSQNEPPEIEVIDIDRNISGN